MTTSLHTDNAATVAGIYEAFGRGDVPAVLDALADNVTFDGDWAQNFAQRAGVGHLQPRLGPAQVAEFFAHIAPWQLDEFSILDITPSARQVVVEVRAAWTLPNGGRFADEELHLWSFDDAGKVVRLRHYVDTAKHIAAEAGIDTLAQG
jgi:ketosteroid isomerase-like protein